MADSPYPDVAVNAAAFQDLTANSFSDQLHAIVNILSAPFSSLTKPLLSSIAPYGHKFDALFIRYLGPVHPQSSSFPLMTPHYALMFALSYLIFVLTCAPLFSLAGFAIKLKPIMRCYNLFMVLLSSYMCIKAIQLARTHHDSLFCVPMLDGAAGAEFAQLVWIFTYSKVVEFLDTVFMIFEGRLRQVSFLHVYHHVTILTYWFAITWLAPGSDAYFSLAGNSFIHVLMYGYYLLASFGYSPWWKYYITKAQITQFCLFCVQSIYVGYVMPEKACDFPGVLAKGLLWYMLTLIALFLHFLATNKGKKKKMSTMSALAPESGKAKSQ
eukprot:GFKZ01016019.1.p1 GENE.GFKZ01016019.1~~GFKZ01016019.1.p1  ORF type:complete len:326 (-),score=25.09 GFKZ01016019.1:1972-2949(-)